ELYRVTYPARGARELVPDIMETLSTAGFEAVLDTRRGLDHGAWIPLRFAYPGANVPVVEVSLLAGGAPEDLLRIGGALAPLRERNVLLLGSGGVVHNLGLVRFGEKNAPVDPWALDFDEWVRDRVAAGDREALIGYRRSAPHADLAVPTTEHFDPLFVVLGAASRDEGVTVLHEGFQYGNLSMRSFLLGG
ncbi:MAG: dioxygenase family protein, partial [Planctomycetota bacterium]